MRRLGGNARITVDLARQVVVRPNGEEIHFDIDPFRKHLLLNGLDDIGQTLQHAAEDRHLRGRASAEPALDSLHHRRVMALPVTALPVMALPVMALPVMAGLDPAIYARTMVRGWPGQARP